MLPPHHLLQLTANRAKAVLGRLAAAVWTPAGSPVCEATAAAPEWVPLVRARRLPRKAVRKGEAWGRLFDQRWVRVGLPRAEASARYLEWRDQGEATLYVEGGPFYGFDVAHRRVALPPRLAEVWLDCVCCQSAIWHPAATGLSTAGSVCDGASLLARDDDAWNAFHDLQVLFDLMRYERPRQASPAPAELNAFGQQAPIHRAAPEYRQLLRWLDRACDAYDSGGAETLQPVLAAAYRDLREENPRARAALVGHAHIDLVWLWPERVGELKTVHSFATANRLMALYPEFRYTHSQSASYEAAERRAPGLSRAVARRIRSGRWEAAGALYVESDTQLPCGEGLVRSLTLGQAGFGKLRGSASRMLWLPDAFGYSGCLPQLLQQAGVDYFFTTKLTWGAVRRFPYSSFVWKGIDGSEVLAHVTQDAGYNNALEIEELQAAATGHAQADIHREFLLPVGYGDGGGGPTEEMCERARRLRSLRGVPAAGWTPAESFFDRLAQVRQQLPVHQGELYLECHRGVLTTRGDAKAAFRALERALQAREAAAVATGRRPDLGEPWRRLVFAQFHDCVTGSSIPEVYVEMVPEWERLAEEQRGAAARELSVEGGEACLFNPLPLPWRGWIGTRHGPASGYVELPPLSGATTASVLRVPPGEVHVGPRSLASDRVDLRLDTRGRIALLVVDGRPIRFSAAAAELVSYPDRPAAFEAWDIDRHTLSLGKVEDAPAAMAASADRTGAGSLVVTRKLGKSSSLSLRFVVEAGQPVVRIEADIEWAEPETLLKLRFPTVYRGTHARFGAPFGSVKRRQQSGPLSGEVAWEVAGSRYAMVTDDAEREGLFIVTEAKYGFSARDGDLAVTLLRSPRSPGSDDQHRAAAPLHLGRRSSEPAYSDLGRHSIRLALGRFDPDTSRCEHAAALAETLFAEPIPYDGIPTGTAFRGLEGGDSLQPSWAQPLKGGRWVLRLHEVAGRAGEAHLKLDEGWLARKVDLLLRPQSALPSGGKVEFRPYEIVNLLLEEAARR